MSPDDMNESFTSSSEPAVEYPRSEHWALLDADSMRDQLDL